MVTAALAAMALTSVARGQACDAPTTPIDLAGAANAVEAAWTELDQERMATADGELVAAVGCISSALTPLDASRFFRVHGYALFVAGQEEAALAAFRAARAIQPHYALPSTLAGPTHPMRVLWDEAEHLPIDSPPIPLPPPSEGWLVVDGKTTDVAPTNRDYLFQRLSATGAVAATSIQRMGTVPTYEQPHVDSGGRPKSKGWLVRGLVTGGVGAVMIGAAGGTRIAYNTIPVERGPLDGLRYTNYGLGAAGITLAAVGVGFGTVALVTSDW